MVPKVEDEGCCVDRLQVCTTGYLDVKDLLLRVGQKCEIKPQESKTYTSGPQYPRRWRAKMIVTKQNNQTSPGTIVNINNPLFLVLADRSDLPLWSMVLCIALYCLGSSISFWKGTLS